MNKGWFGDFAWPFEGFGGVGCVLLVLHDIDTFFIINRCPYRQGPGKGLWWREE